VLVNINSLVLDTYNAKYQIIMKDSTPVKNRRDVRIILADDNIINMQILLHFIENNFCFFTDIAVTGKEVINLLEKADYDLVLMDCFMPEMDGYEATKIIRDINSAVRNHDIPIIALTANTMKGDREKCLKVGMNDYIAKPFKADELTKAIERYVYK